MNSNGSRPERKERSDAGRPLADSVLRLIWQEERISRAEIARRTELARSTVSEIVSSLLPTGLIAEVGRGPSRGGRRPIVLQFQDRAFGLLGIEMGAAHVAVVITDLRGRVLVDHEEAFPVRDDPDGTCNLMVELADRCIEEWGQGIERLVGIGVALPAPVDPADPQRFSEVVLPAWRDKRGFAELSERYNARLLIDNDANLGALAERWWGAGRGVDDFAYVKVATGIGSGHVVGGEIYRGATGVAGEIGHLVVVPDGLPCVCGNRGCLASVVGTQAIVERARDLVDNGTVSILDRDSVSMDSIEEAALQSDPLALQLTEEAAGHLGTALAGMLNLMNPSMVVIGGGLARLGDLLVDPLRAAVRSRTLISSVAVVDLRTSELGPHATAIGAATLVLKEALADSRLFPQVSTTSIG